MAEKKPRTDEKARAREKLASANITELRTRERELREELFNLRFQFATRQLTNTARIAQVRREIARVKTLQRQRELAAS